MDDVCAPARSHGSVIGNQLVRSLAEASSKAPEQQ
jgi:hypothetical protein